MVRRTAKALHGIELNADITITVSIIFLLESGWNVLDFIVVCMGILELTSFGNYTFIRCFRALRPLRTITKIESLRVGYCFRGRF